MMGLVARTSRRSALLFILGGLFVLALVVVIKDLNDKLTVMTNSNQNYQRMTDKQIEKIKTLQNGLRKEKEMHENRAQQLQHSEDELRLKNQKESRQLNQNIKSLQMENRKLQSEKEQLQNEYDSMSTSVMESNHRLNQMSTDNAKLMSENERLREQLTHFSQISAERDTYKNQYLALFKQHQVSSDSIQALKQEKERLQLQLQDSQTNTMDDSGKKKSSSLGLSQLKEPKNVVVKQSSYHKPPSSSSQKSVLQQQAFIPNNKISSTSESSLNNKMAPVAAEPPLKSQQHQIVHPNLIHKEDVMEAPKLNNNPAFHQYQQQEFNQYFHQPQQIVYHQPQQQQQHHQPNLDKPNVHQLYHQSNNFIQQHHQLLEDEDTDDQDDDHFPFQSGNRHDNSNNIAYKRSKSNMGRPPVRFQRREIDYSNSNKHFDNNFHQLPLITSNGQELRPIPTGQEDTITAEGGEEEDDGVDHLQPYISRGHTIDHDANEDSNAGEDDIYPYNRRNPSQMKPADFGVHHVNYEENQLKKIYQPQRYVNAQHQYL